MTYSEDIAAYMLPNGVVTLGERDREGNLVRADNSFLFTATHAFLIRKLPDNIGVDPLAGSVFAFLNYLDERTKLGRGGIPLPEKSWGGANISHDEINGIASLGPNFGQKMDKGPWWIFNATGKFWDYFGGWYYRMAYLVPFIKVVAGKTPNWFDQWWYARDIRRVTRLPLGDTSRRCLLVLQSQYIARFPEKMKQAMDEFLDACARDYGDLSGLYSIYFPNHPFARHTVGVKFK